MVGSTNSIETQHNRVTSFERVVDKQAIKTFCSFGKPRNTRMRMKTAYTARSS